MKQEPNLLKESYMCERCGEQPATECSGYGINKEPVCKDCLEEEQAEAEEMWPDWILANF